MKKKTALFVLASFVLSLALLQNRAVENVNTDTNLQQLGAGCIAAACTSENNTGTWAAAGGILIGAGVNVITHSVPASWSPIGWYGLAAGCIL